jgi:N-acetylglucosaminyldiphosphoundecaprenol N-acetyl-beta-D-mannosaminyltransferase
VILTSSSLAGVKVPRQTTALGRKLVYAASHVVRVDSFEPLKRAFDVVFALIALILTSPFLLCFFVFRKISGKPILTRSERVGKLGRRYTQYGLAGLDRRRVFRKLPLLLNILAGDMSFIGPRPAAPGDPVMRLNGRARLFVKPGVICSWWLRQRANIDFDDEAAADHEYLNTASLASDFGIALRAIPALVFSEKREAGPPTVEILGLRIDNLSMAEALKWIRQRLNDKGQAVVSITNAHCANVSCLNAAYRQSLLTSGLNLADGLGLRLAGKLKRTPIRQNVNGTDLFPRLCSMLEGTGKSLYLLGGLPGVAQRAAEWIAVKYPGTVIAGYRDGFFKPDEERSVAEAIRRSGASVLLVGMGVPLQELWIQRNLKETGVRVAIGVGALFDFYSGRIPRAPVWLRELGMEWVYRLLQEPGRMWRRYLIGNWTFMARHLLYEMKVYRPQCQTSGGRE